MMHKTHETVKANLKTNEYTIFHEVVGKISIHTRKPMGYIGEMILHLDTGEIIELYTPAHRVDDMVRIVGSNSTNQEVYDIIQHRQHGKELASKLYKGKAKVKSLILNKTTVKRRML